MTESSRAKLYTQERRRTTEREALAEWVGREILPHESELRIWLRRRLIAMADVEDVVQECYVRLARLSDVSHIAVPRAYLFTMARNLAEQQRKRARVVRIESLADATETQLDSDPLSPDRFAIARQELSRVQSALATLSDRARRIFIMRRVEGLSQKEIAEALGVSEAVVENEASRGLRAVLKLLTKSEAGEASITGGVGHARSR